MTEINITDGLKEGEGEVSVNSTNNNENDKNNVIAVQFDDSCEKLKKKVVVDTRDNWMARFLYGGPIGLTINFTLLVAITLHFAVTIRGKLEDEYFYEECFKKIWLRQLMQACFLFAPLDILYHALLVLVLFPLSRLSRSTGYNWLLGVSMTSLMFAMLFTNHLLGIETMSPIRTIAGVEWLRLSMKVASFLIECNRSKEVFDKSSIRTLLYFIFIPNLVYKHEYPRARRIRWIKVVSHIWWLWIVLVPVYALALPLLPYFLIDITKIPLILLLVILLFSPISFAIIYFAGIHFPLFENFCGLYGEVLAYPDLKTFGPWRKIFKGTHAPRQINIKVSDWLQTYVTSRFLKATGSRFKAILCTFVLSFFFHDVVITYMCGFSILHITIITAIALSLLMNIPQASTRMLEVLHACLFLIVCGIWSSCCTLEFLARNYSSIPGAENEPLFRWVPLFMSVIIERVVEEVSF